LFKIWDILNIFWHWQRFELYGCFLVKLLLLLLLLDYYLNPRKNEDEKKIKKNTKKFEVEKLVRLVLRGKTVVQQYGVKTLNDNRNALK